MLPAHLAAKSFVIAPALLALAVLSGCVKDRSRVAAVAEPAPVVREAEPVPAEPVVRYGRYTLVSTQPEPAQQDLLAQIIDTRIPADMNPTVQQAMQHVLRHCGYSLCPAVDKPIVTLYSRPLPAAHYRIGPVTLRTALQLLAGKAFVMNVDEIERQICFAVHTDKPSEAVPVRHTATADRAVMAGHPAQSNQP